MRAILNNRGVQALLGLVQLGLMGWALFAGFGWLMGAAPDAAAVVAILSPFAAIMAYIGLAR